MSNDSGNKPPSHEGVEPDNIVAFDQSVTNDGHAGQPSLTELLKGAARDWYRRQADVGVHSPAAPADQIVEDDWEAEDYAELRANGHVRCINTDVATRYDAVFDALTLAGREGTRVINAHNALDKAMAERDYYEPRHLGPDDASALKELDSAVSDARIEWHSATDALFDCLREGRHASLDVLAAYGVKTCERLAVVMSDDGSYTDSAN